MPKRNCIRCNAEIDQCMGFQLARDSLLAMDGKIAWSQVREHCGKCCMWLTKHEFIGGPDISVDYLNSIPELDHV